MKISSLSDALSVMDYLLKRELMCGKCGLRLTEWTNANHARCEGCKPKFGDYNKAVAPNEFERRLCEAMHQWLADDSVGSHADAEGASEPKADIGQP